MTQESLAGVRVVRAYGQEAFEIERFRRANEEYVVRNRALIRLQGMYFPSMGLLMGIGALLVLWIGSREVIAGRMTIGELVAFNTYLMMLGWPMIAFGWVTNLLQRGMASWKRMLDVLDAQPAITDEHVPASPITRIQGAIEFRHLTFRYGDVAVLHDVSLTIPAGTTTAIVGATGSGKSTLLSLLPRLHERTAGHGLRRRCGRPGDSAGDAARCHRIRGAGAVSVQCVGRGQHRLWPVPSRCARPRSIEDAAATARLDKDIETFPNGYDTLVGERGITLSGGQKQRTAIARALVMSPAILVLDDALSAVDTHTEEEILQRLSRVMRQRTSIIVSHRVSTVRGADQIVVLEHGHVAESGTHDALVRHGGLYAELYRKQLLEEELAAS